MRTAATYASALVAGFLGFYAGLWTLLTAVGLDGAGDLAFALATTGGAGLLAGVTAGLVARLRGTEVVGLTGAAMVIAMTLGVAVSMAGGDAAWTGAAALVAAVAAAAVASQRSRV